MEGVSSVRAWEPIIKAAVSFFARLFLCFLVFPRDIKTRYCWRNSWTGTSFMDVPKTFNVIVEKGTLGRAVVRQITLGWEE